MANIDGWDKKKFIEFRKIEQTMRKDGEYTSHFDPWYAYYLHEKEETGSIDDVYSLIYAYSKHFNVWQAKNKYNKLLEKLGETDERYKAVKMIPDKFTSINHRLKPVINESVIVFVGNKKYIKPNEHIYYVYCMSTGKREPTPKYQMKAFFGNKKYLIERIPSNHFNKIIIAGIDLIYFMNDDFFEVANRILTDDGYIVFKRKKMLEITGEPYNNVKWGEYIGKKGFKTMKKGEDIDANGVFECKNKIKCRAFKRNKTFHKENAKPYKKKQVAMLFSELNDPREYKFWNYDLTNGKFLSLKEDMKNDSIIEYIYEKD